MPVLVVLKSKGLPNGVFNVMPSVSAAIEHHERAVEAGIVALYNVVDVSVERCAVQKADGSTCGRWREKGKECPLALAHAVEFVAATKGVP